MKTETLKNCEHMQFEVQANVTRLTEKEGGPVTGYSMDIKVQCAECKTKFEFIGTPNGYSPDRPMASADFCTLAAPIRPETGQIATKLSFQVKPSPSANKGDIN